MKRIILDTNFLLIPGQFKVDIFEEIRRISDFKYELCIIDKSMDELKKIIETQKQKNRQAAKIALQLIKMRRIAQIKTGEGNVDNLILELLDKDYILATQDALLRKIAVKKGIKVMFLRSKKYLVLK